MKRTVNWMICILVVALLLTLSACGESSAPVNPATDADSASQAVGNQPEGNLPLPTERETEPESEDVIEQPTSQIIEPLPADPQPVEIGIADGRTLEGLYYPAKVDNAPVVVLMHWALGNMQDWVAIAPWLQNRPDELDGAENWFPPMPDEVSFAVLAFNFGNYGGSAYGGSRESYVEDALAAVAFAAALAGVDSHRVITLGASIGADGAVDSCYLFNDAGEGGTCIGALSLSPGNYLTGAFTYAQAAEMIDLAGYPVWCLAAESDYESPEVCRSLEGAFSRAFIFPGSDHGMVLVSAEAFPDEPLLDLNTMQILQEFLETTTGIPLNDFDLP